MVLAILALFTDGVALAGVGWFLRPPETALDHTVDVPLYRGVFGEHRPLVHASFGEDRAGSSVLAIVDLGGEWTRIGTDLATELGLAVKSGQIRGKTVQRTVIEEVSLGDFTLRELRAEVVSGSELILGLGIAGHIGIGILPSEGVVRFAPPDDIAALLAGAGGPLPAFGQDTSQWLEHGEPRFGNGLSLAVPIDLDGNPAGAWIRTDWARTRLTGTGAQIRIAGHDLSVRPILDESLGDPADDFVGGVGYDVLYAYDLVLSPQQDRMAIQFVPDPKWEDATSIAVAISKLRFETWRAVANEAEAASGPKIGFEADIGTSIIAGDPGDLSAANHHGSLADVLWMGADPDGAVQASLAATQFAGDRCDPFLTLGIRRMQVSGALQQQEFVAKLVRDPLQRAGELWDAWASLDTAEREAVRAGKDLDALTFQLPQPGICTDAGGHYALALLAQGNGDEVLEMKLENGAYDRQFALALGLARLRADDPSGAEKSIRMAMGMGGRGDILTRFALAAARLAQEKPVPKLAVDPDRGDAVFLALASRVLKPVDAPDTIPEALAAAIYGEGTTDGLAERLVEASKRRAGSPEVACQQAILLAISEDPDAAAETLEAARSHAHRIPDYWLAKYIIAISAWELDDAEDALVELRMRFPALPLKIAR